MKKILIIILLFNSIMLFGLGINDKDYNCKYFIGKNENNKNATKKFNLFDGVMVY